MQSNHVRKVRAAKGFSQVELAAHAGVGIATLNKLENWNFRPSPATAEKLAKALGCKPSDIFPTTGK